MARRIPSRVCSSNDRSDAHIGPHGAGMSGPAPRPVLGFRILPPTTATSTPPIAPSSTRRAPDSRDTSGTRPTVAVPTTASTNPNEPNIPNAAPTGPAAATQEVRTATVAIAAAAHQG